MKRATCEPDKPPKQDKTLPAKEKQGQGLPMKVETEGDPQKGDSQKTDACECHAKCLLKGKWHHKKKKKEEEKEANKSREQRKSAASNIICSNDGDADKSDTIIVGVDENEAITEMREELDSLCRKVDKQTEELRALRTQIQQLEQQSQWLIDEIRRANERVGQMRSPDGDYLQAKKNLEERLKRKMEDDLQVQATELKQAADREKVAMEEQLKQLLEEIDELKSVHSPAYRPAGFSIEDYFPAIDRALEAADSCKFDEDNPETSYYALRQQLDEIKKQLSAYRSQR